MSDPSEAGQFLPSGNTTTALLATPATFALGFVMLVMMNEIRGVPLR